MTMSLVLLLTRLDATDDYQKLFIQCCNMRARTTFLQFQPVVGTSWVPGSYIASRIRKYLKKLYIAI